MMSPQASVLLQIFDRHPLFGFRVHVTAQDVGASTELHGRNCYTRTRTGAIPNNHTHQKAIAPCAPTKAHNSGLTEPKIPERTRATTAAL